MHRIVVGLAAAVAVTIVGAATAADDPIAARQEVMSNLGGAARVGAGMAREERDFDADAAMLVFRTINAGIIGAAELFPEGSETGGDTEALPAIWEDMEGFLERAEALRQASAEAIEAEPADLASFRPLFQSVAENCGRCHETYRRDDD